MHELPRRELWEGLSHQVSATQPELNKSLKRSDWCLLMQEEAVTYYKPANSPQLHAKHFPEEVERRSPISQAAFVGKAWKLANDKARELGWIV